MSFIATVATLTIASLSADATFDGWPGGDDTMELYKLPRGTVGGQC